MKKPKPVQHRLEYFAFRLVICLIDALPSPLSVRLATYAAKFVHYILPRKLTRYQIAKENLQMAFDNQLTSKQIDKTILNMWIHLFRLVIEMIQLRRKLRLSNCADIFTFVNRDLTVQTLCAGRPVIFLGGHYGNWEMANVLFGLFGFSMGIVARDLDNPFLHEWFVKSREATGQKLISKKGGSNEMAWILEHSGILAMLCDQDAGSRGLFVPFFGKNASTFKSIALIALQYRALICVGYARRLKDDFTNNRWVRYEMGCEEIIDPLDYDDVDAVKQITEDYTQALERAIRRSPEQYFWVHRRWKSKPRKRKKIQPSANENVLPAA